eukprot:TRINITY_DN76317_c0_g1_i1.p1 TRINITY_DN76317_c0_g1~~TRINITY_DN76317_c0_g1_i1.p1  ORF type:complete len:256 (+),score=29.99 TRINITY_DN76317_c0_g1_i1:72-770(+)
MAHVFWKVVYSSVAISFIVRDETANGSKLYGQQESAAMDARECVASRVQMKPWSALTSVGLQALKQDIDVSSQKIPLDWHLLTIGFMEQEHSKLQDANDAIKKEAEANLKNYNDGLGEYKVNEDELLGSSGSSAIDASKLKITQKKSELEDLSMSLWNLSENIRDLKGKISHRGQDNEKLNIEADADREKLVALVREVTRLITVGESQADQKESVEALESLRAALRSSASSL